ncbi:MAG: DUF3782 domain-containing protein [Bacteroidia bacterium]|nr:DUF3782 domain-containing protein [Bacteroidia bacterium]
MEEIREILRQLAASQLETDRRMQETDRQMQETDRRMQETDRRMQETDRQIQEGNRVMQESNLDLRERQKETDRVLQETERQLKLVGRQVGSLSQSLGFFAEGLAFPSIERIMMQRFGATTVSQNVKIRTPHGTTIELDVLGVANGDRNTAVVAEVKTKLRDEHVQELIDTLKALPSFLPEHRDKKRFGILVGGNVPDSVHNLAIRSGLFVGRATEEAFDLLIPEGFEGRDFRLE